MKSFYIFAQLLSVEVRSTISIDSFRLINVPVNEFFKEIYISTKKIVRWAKIPYIVSDKLAIIAKFHEFLQTNDAEILSFLVIYKERLQ